MDFNFDTPSSTPSLLFSDFTANLPPSTNKSAAVDVSKFHLDGFSDFNLDLSVLSRPVSPASSPSLHASTSSGQDLPASRSPSPSTTSHPVPSDSESNNLLRRVASGRLSPAAVTSVIRGSWPMISRMTIGRGTPSDPTRKSEWAGISYDEDGRLTNNNRSTSTDLPVRRSLSDSDYYLPTSPQPFVLPESSKIQLDGLGAVSDHAEWDSLMQTVLGHGPETPSTSTTSAPATPAPATPKPQQQSSLSPLPLADIALDPETLEIDLGLEKALDLGFGLEKRNKDGTGRVYSTASRLPTSSRPVSVVDSQTNNLSRHEQESQEETKVPEKAEPEPEAKSSPSKASSALVQSGPNTHSPWWKKILGKLQKLFRPKQN
ncbi:uncharacterized protein BT62DRAFT_219465 [Guyanagaster necrorhizus]|uniref:Uncharacterized protein n=1 Tax=Guyanagaster necrorhizus TaxID=856835 RepID=A0A9P8ASA4_9AGAR|nr:uncharacterized protein BT62DRAFT_219465 [Guyanagaster necrorhizus MCA 3950]KAG7444667.1 hypothetical protein BT62DRAFT_219465 [Guyanagaster necrorhizus MCA 3950]